MSLISKIQSLISSANAVTGESRTDLTSAVQDLKDGYGGSTVEKGLVFSEYDSDGYPHKAEFVGFTEIPDDYCHSCFNVKTGAYSSATNTMGKKITTITVPQGVTSIGANAFDSCWALLSVDLPDTLQQVGSGVFRYCGALQSIHYKNDLIFTGKQQIHRFCYQLISAVFDGEVDKIVTDCFGSCTNLMLLDLSHCTAIPPLHNLASLQHANGCVIKIPLALSDQTLGTGNGWESQTNWSGLTDVVWQGV